MKRSAVFLDRDGTLNKKVENLTSPDQLELLPGVGAAIQKLNQAYVRAIVVTNQPVLAKGFCTYLDVQAVHNQLETLLEKEQAFLDAIYYCPHHPDKGFAGERPELKTKCTCRKPNLGMIELAIGYFDIDVSTSWLIGDSTTDIQTAKNAGLLSILVKTGNAGTDRKYSVTPDFTSDNLNQAVDLILAFHDHHAHTT